jgi:alcohol dehydrogenase class IV
VIQRYTEIARLLTTNPSAKAEDGIAWVWQLMGDLQIQRLSYYGVQAEDIEEIAEKSSAASSMKANPIVLERGELEKIIMLAL